MFKRFLAVFFCLFALPALASKLAVINDPVVINVPNGLTVDQVKKSAMAGLTKHNWIVAEDGPNGIVASVSPRDISAKIHVSYDTKTITITYVDSTNMLYREDGGRRLIHETYNRWMNYLDVDMQHAIAAESAGGDATSAVATPAAAPGH